MSVASAEREVTYLEAISQALDEEMARDEAVFLMGEDIGPYGGAFRITEGFQKKYGDWRVLDTPLAESGFVGAAIGAAMMGMRPVVEMQFADFISCAFDQITEVAAKIHYQWGAAVPIVIRAPYGGGVHGSVAANRGGHLRRRPTTPKDCSRPQFVTPTRSSTSSTNSCTAA